MFDGSLISEREMADRGISLGSSVLEKLKPAQVRKPEPTLVINKISKRDGDSIMWTPPQSKQRKSAVRELTGSSSPLELIPLPADKTATTVYNYKFEPMEFGCHETGDLISETSHFPCSAGRRETGLLDDGYDPNFVPLRSVILDPSCPLSEPAGLNQEAIHYFPFEPPIFTRSEGTAVNASGERISVRDKEFSKIIYGFDLKEVLQSNSSTRLIISKKVAENRFILRSDRQAIASTLIDAVIEKLGTSPSKNALEQLARNLVATYPVFGDPRRQEYGWQMWFFHTVKGNGATGFLEDRLKNQRRKLATKRQTQLPDPFEVENLNWDSENDYNNPTPDDSRLEFLKHNFGPEVTETMKETVFMRRSLLRGYVVEQFAGLQKAMQSMPRLFDMERMIIQDFNVRHPSLKLILYDRWPKVAKLLLEYAEESGICYQKKLDISKHRYDLNDGDVGLIAFCLLPFILPSCARKANQMDCESEDENEPTASIKAKRSKQKVGPRKRQVTVKASDLDSLRSMILFKSKNTHVSEVLSQNKRIAPFILALGASSNLEFDNYFVIINKVAIPCGPNFFVALDTCFKSFTVLYLPPPIESFDHWLFIQHGVCGRPAKNTELPPVVQALIGQIMYRI